jgi:hypothetical protein
MVDLNAKNFTQFSISQNAIVFLALQTILSYKNLKNALCFEKVKLC